MAAAAGVKILGGSSGLYEHFNVGGPPLSNSSFWIIILFYLINTLNKYYNNLLQANLVATKNLKTIAGTVFPFFSRKEA